MSKDAEPGTEQEDGPLADPLEADDGGERLIAKELNSRKDGQESERKDTVAEDTHDTLKYQLLGPSLTKAGQDSVDQTKVAEIIYNASRGSKFFNHEESRDKVLTEKIDRILARKDRLTPQELARYRREADAYLEQLELTRDLSQHIVHVDCDAFFAAVEELDRPELKDVPFAVVRVLTTCNYHARRFGVRSGMASFVAMKLCPQLILIPNNHEKYRAKAAEVRDIFADYDPRFESASIDEAYLNVTAYCAAHPDPDTGQPADPAAVVDRMRREIHERTRVTVSAGIAPNARLAKVCSNLNKPNGQYVLPSHRADVVRFAADLPTRKLSGIGRVMERELAAVGIATLGDVYARRDLVKPLFGDKAYAFLMHAYLGLGRTRIQPAEEYVRKSVGTERTFHAISGPDKLRERLRRTTEDLEAELAKAGVRGRTVVLKVKLHTFEVLTRQVVAPRPVHKADDLYALALPILAKLEAEAKAGQPTTSATTTATATATATTTPGGAPQPVTSGLCIRLMGVRCTHLVSDKKPNTMAFFGLRTDDESHPHHNHNNDPQIHPRPRRRRLGKVAPARPRPPLPDTTLDSPEATTPNPQEEEEEEARSPPAPSRWDCPVCARPQPADERLFNEHMDLCLSRQTIREALHDEGDLVDARDQMHHAQQQQQQQQRVALRPESNPHTIQNDGKTPMAALEHDARENEPAHGVPPAREADGRAGQAEGQTNAAIRRDNLEGEVEDVDGGRWNSSWSMGSESDAWPP
ncbi:unnamed protein product [Parascedosporium putredinis]|uniref:DNA polymerase kappa n=1 Tax=Parascedosporium putredinis TaxID=1442378 RepID=A0A9P1M9A2_9PEZI|nr:unnamed protein product [Parascedosporium putredinis]CAI7994253.1 unnamed protein product [Parascedosporium putredinis]